MLEGREEGLGTFTRAKPEKLGGLWIGGLVS